jgi:hypothetical protein
MYVTCVRANERSCSYIKFRMTVVRLQNLLLEKWRFMRVLRRSGSPVEGTLIDFHIWMRNVDSIEQIHSGKNHESQRVLWEGRK